MLRSAPLPLIAAFLIAPLAAEAAVVTFDAGWEGWNAPSEKIASEGGNPGAHVHLDHSSFGVTVWTDSHTDFVGDHSGHSQVLIGLDVRAEQIENLNGPTTRPLIVEFRRYGLGTDGHPYASVWHELGTLQSGMDWQTWSLGFDPTTTTLPDGWSGTGAESSTGELTLPDGVTFADILAQTDEVAFSTEVPGTFSSSVYFNVRIDNLSIETQSGTGPGKVPQYEIIDLGTFGGELANALAINDAGAIAGVAMDDNMVELPFIWQNGDMQYLGTLNPAFEYDHGIGRGISNNGYVVGYSMAPATNFPGTVAHPFLWSDTDGMIDLTPGSDTSGWAWDVNSSGQVVGEGIGAFLWTAEGGMVSIGSGSAEAINEQGQVAGWGANAQSQMRGWVYDSQTGQTRELGTLGGNFNETRDINDAGNVVGYTTMASSQTRPVMWKADDTIVDLGYLPIPDFSTGIANAINDSDWIVGRDNYDGWSKFPNKGWLWIDGSKYELKSLIVDPVEQSKWIELPHPLGINNRGEIIGIGIREGMFGRAFLMRPLNADDAIFADGFEASGG